MAISGSARTHKEILDEADSMLRAECRPTRLGFMHRPSSFSMYSTMPLSSWLPGRPGSSSLSSQRDCNPTTCTMPTVVQGECLSSTRKKKSDFVREVLPNRALLPQRSAGKGWQSPTRIPSNGYNICCHQDAGNQVSVLTFPPLPRPPVDISRLLPSWVVSDRITGT